MDIWARMSSLEIWGREVLVSEGDGETDVGEFVAVEGVRLVDHRFSVTFVGWSVSQQNSRSREGACTQNVISDR